MTLKQESPASGGRRAGGGSSLAARPAPMNCPYRCSADRLYRQLAPPAHCAAPPSIATTHPAHTLRPDRDRRGRAHPSGPPMKALPRRPASRLEQLLRSRQFVITAEIAPPVSCDAE